MSRPGFVLEVDDRTPPLLVHEGEGFRLETLPARHAGGLPAGVAARLSTTSTRAIQRRAAAAHRQSSRCPSCCRPGMKLTIAFDDISLPLPPMRSPDIRQRIIEAVLDAGRRGRASTTSS